MVEVTLELTCQGWITFAIEAHNALGLLENGMHKIIYPARLISQGYWILPLIEISRELQNRTR